MRADPYGIIPKAWGSAPHTPAQNGLLLFIAMATKYLFVVGGVMSGVGKGVAAASVARLLKSRGYRVTAVKIDPYINVDAGTMNPTEHGEVFVTEDGDETDQDIGNYERFLGQDILSTNYMTTGRVYQTVIERERNLEYGGKCVEVVPHIPEEVVRRLKKAARLAKADIVIVEVGGTVGEYQNILFLEAARMMQVPSPADVAFMLVSYLPVPGNIGEMKTKPTQYAIRTMNASGINPDFIICRAVQPLDGPRKGKLASVASIPPERVISAPDMASIYEVPLAYAKEKLDAEILKRFSLPQKKAKLQDWERFVKRIKSLKQEVKIGIVGKYFQTGDFTLADSYLSVIEAIKHACWQAGVKPNLTWLNAESYERDPKAVRELNSYHGIIVPGGYGSRGVEGKILAIRFCREQKIPYLGLCYGMQLACIEFGRHVVGLEGAHTTEVNDKTKHPVIHTMEEQVALLKNKRYGGTMRLGANECELKNGTIARRAYGRPLVMERHRHRYEFNNAYRADFRKHGLVFSGLYPKKDLVEIVELPKDKHPFFVGVQFHPEFKSRPMDPHPLFLQFIKAAIA